MDDEAAAIGLEVNLDKTKVQALGTHQTDQEVLDLMGTKLQSSTNLFIFEPWHTPQSTAAMISTVAVVSLAVQCKTLITASGNHDLH